MKNGDKFPVVVGFISVIVVWSYCVIAFIWCVIGWLIVVERAEWVQNNISTGISKLQMIFHTSSHKSYPNKKQCKDKCTIIVLKC